MTTSPSALDAELARLMGEAEAKSSNDSKIVVLKPRAQVYRIRILPFPGSVQWWLSYGTHFIKNPNYVAGVKDSKKGMMFMCDQHTNDKPCAICDGVAKGKKNPDPVYAQLAKDAWSGQRHIANFVDMENPTKVQVLRLSTTFRNVLFQIARLKSLRFFDLNSNYVIHLMIAGDENKPEYKIMGVEEPTPTGFTEEHLHNLRAVIDDEFGNLASPAQFSGNFYDPLIRTPALGAPVAPIAGMLAPGGIPMMAPPMLAAPTAAPAPVTYAPQPVAYAPQAPVAPMVAVAPAPQPMQPVYAAPAPVAAPVAAPVVYQTVAAAPAMPVAQPVPKAAPVAVMPVAAAQPAAAGLSAAEMEAKLLSMVS